MQKEGYVERDEGRVRIKSDVKWSKVVAGTPTLYLDGIDEGSEVSDGGERRLRRRLAEEDVKEGAVKEN